MVEPILGILGRLSPRAMNLLHRIQCGEDQELVYEKGAGWWLEHKRVAARDAVELLRAAAIIQSGGDPRNMDYQRWEVSNRGRQFLDEVAEEKANG